MEKQIKIIEEIFYDFDYHKIEELENTIKRMKKLKATHYQVNYYQDGYPFIIFAK